MKKSQLRSKILAISGTVLVGLPILFMLVTAVVGSILSHRFLFDYMAPAELGWVVLAGGAFLFWAAIREHRFIKPIAWTAGAAILLIVGCQGLAVISGLASGRVETSDVPVAYAFSTAMLIGYDLAVVVLDVFGILLTRVIFRRNKPTDSSSV
jgi:hypothetical protein